MVTRTRAPLASPAHKPNRSATDVARAAAALVVLVALLVAPPVLLTRFVGNPLDGLSLTAALTDEALAGLLACVVWVAWAQLVVSVLVEVPAAVRGVSLPRALPLTGAHQLVARRLITTILAVSTVAGPLTARHSPAHAEPPAVGTRGASAAVSAIHESQPGGTSLAVASPAQARKAAMTPTAAALKVCVVRPPIDHKHDSLWAIAERHLGDGARYREIYELNKQRRQPDGGRLRLSSLIQPGWQLIMPADAVNLPLLAADPDSDPAAVDADLTGAAIGSVDVTVGPGDTLSELAADQGLTDWASAWHVNEGRAEPGGARFSDPDLIHPGWTITLPSAGTAAKPSVDPSPAAPSASTVEATPAPATVQRQPDALIPAPPAPDAPTPATSAAAATVLPTASPETAPTAAATEHDDDDRTGNFAASPFAVLAGGGALLAGATLAALTAHRRRQFRHRRPGRVIAASPPELAPVEQALRTHGSAALDQMSFLDAALRSLSLQGAALPPVAAARISAQDLTLVLAQPVAQPPAAPWEATSADRWVLDRAAVLPETAVAGAHRPAAPYPCLVSVGTDDAGGDWLLDLEQAGAIALTGDADHTVDLARFIAAELATNAWSDQLVVTLAGFGQELTAANPARVLHVDDLSSVAGHVLRDMAANIAAADANNIDVLDGRRTGTAADLWMPHVLLAAASEPADIVALEQLLSAAAEQQGRTAIAVIACAGPDLAQNACELHLAADGLLTIPALNLTLHARQLPQWLAADVASAIALARDGETDMPAPASTADRAGESYLDVTGAVLPQHTTPRTEGITVQHDGSTSTMLEAATDTYLAVSATTAEDIAALSPNVPAEVADALLLADPDLDADLAAWLDAGSNRAKLTLLGPLSVIAHGRPPAKQLSLYTEVVAYLALHPAGVSPDQFANDLWPHKNYAGTDTYPRQVASAARTWLGDHPVTREPYIARAGGGFDKYALSGLLVDAELFRRLRARGQARGAAGMPDLLAALDLVTGSPLGERRPGGWGWLEPGEELIYLAGVVDVAHIVATHALAVPDLEMARRAALAALAAGDPGDTALLDMVAICDAAGNHAEAQAYVQRILDHHDAEVEEDLPPRTFDVLRRREWLPVAM